MTNLSLAQLRQAIAIKERIDGLQLELNRVLGKPAGTTATSRVLFSGRATLKRSAAVRARMAASQRARWANKARGLAVTGVSAGAPRKMKRYFSPAARARIAAATKARWEKIRASGKRTLG